MPSNAPNLARAEAAIRPTPKRKAREVWLHKDLNRLTLCSDLSFRKPRGGVLTVCFADHILFREVLPRKRRKGAATSNERVVAAVKSVLARRKERK